MWRDRSGGTTAPYHIEANHDAVALASFRALTPYHQVGRVLALHLVHVHMPRPFARKPFKAIEFGPLASSAMHNVTTCCETIERLNIYYYILILMILFKEGNLFLRPSANKASLRLLVQNGKARNEHSGFLSVFGMLQF